MKYFVDANIFLRFLLADHPKQSPQAKQLFEKASIGEVNLITLPIVIAEIVWVLSSYYKESTSDVAGKIRQILFFKGLEVIDQSDLLVAVQIFESQNIDFIDAYISGWMLNQKITGIFSFDKDFDKIENIQRIELIRQEVMRDSS